MDGMQPVHADERSYINHREDLVSLRPGREHAWLDTAIEKLLKVFPCRLFDVSRMHRVNFTFALLISNLVLVLRLYHQAQDQ